jgi:hypothetical protein
MGEVFGLAAIACARAIALFADFLLIGEKVGAADCPDSLRALAGMNGMHKSQHPRPCVC